MEWPCNLTSWNRRFFDRILCFCVVMLVAGPASTTMSYFDVENAPLPEDPETLYFRPQGHQRDRSLKGGNSGPSYLLAQSPGVAMNSGKGPTGPHFLNMGSKRNVSTAVGQTAYLHCHVADLGDKAQVSWIRKRDLHVLSSGQVVFASDQRFQVLHPVDSDKWTLQIKYTQTRDAGIYECQVNTEPKISKSYFLSVVESRAKILGPEYVKAGSTINLTCVVNQPSTQSLVYWYHNKEILDYEGSVSINTRSAGEQTTSHLTITKATTKHSGNYTCWPTSAQPASAIVNVVEEGEQPAAMQTGSGSSFRLNYELCFLPGLLQAIVSLSLFRQYDLLSFR
ncbi:zwei Ig domain protein zig-8-like [Macrobrachium rosenbergii]|uniref:zwei Ig domain protein zig-8-like n=1 Tax=Macrobrachium rosenbergii TaxID=79674 RepID=UPI0034D6DEBF